VEYLCTACGTLHAAEVKACGTEPIQDVKLVDGAFP
jgi:hypothetical protein